MKFIASLLLTFALLTSSLIAEVSSVSVAKVDYNRIDKLLEQVVLSGPEHKELRETYLAQKKQDVEDQKKMTAAIMKGEKINPMAAAARMMDRGDREKVSQLCQKYLLMLIEQTFKGKYKIILKDGYSGVILYTEVPIEDITDIIRQELLKKSPEQ